MTISDSVMSSVEEWTHLRISQVMRQTAHFRLTYYPPNLLVSAASLRIFPYPPSFPIQCGIDIFPTLQTACTAGLIFGPQDLLPHSEPDRNRVLPTKQETSFLIIHLFYSRWTLPQQQTYREKWHMTYASMRVNGYTCLYVTPCSSCNDL